MVRTQTKATAVKMKKKDLKVTTTQFSGPFVCKV